MDILYYSVLFASGVAFILSATVISGYIYGKVYDRTGKDPLGVDTNE